MEIVVGALRTTLGEAAVARAVQEAAKHEATLHVVGFLEIPRGDEDAPSHYLEESSTLQTEIERWMSRTAPDDVDVVVHVPHGYASPSQAILHVRDEVEAELIVIGLRNRSRVGKALLGSNAHEILMGAHCPVLAVPAEVG